MKILIVDDHDLFAEGLRLLIENLNEAANFTIATSYQEGLKAISSDAESETFDLVLLDYNLPGAPLDQSIETFSELAKAAPVIVISSEDSREIIRKAIHAGAAGFIPKSSSKEVLISALDHVLSGGTFLPKQVLSNYEPVETPEKISALTKQQQNILSYVVKGTSNKVIASQLDIAEGTVKAHLHNAFKILGVKNRTEAVLAVAKHQITF